MLGGITAWSVDALGVDRESTGSVGENGQRGVPAVRGRISIQGGGGIADASPVGRSAEFTPDHQDRRKLFSGEPGRWQIDPFLALGKARHPAVGSHRRQLSALHRNAFALHLAGGPDVDLIPQRPAGQLAPCGI